MTNKPMLPCPFCGSDPFPLEWPEGGDTGEVRCLELDCPIDDVFIPIDQWNRPRIKVPVNSETVAVFEIDHSGYRARVVLDPAKPFPPDGTLLYAEQAAPVADHTQCEECKGWGYQENHHEGGGTECGECGGSGKSTVSVVMPEPYSLAMFQMISGFESVTPEQFDLVWSACREEVSRLNGIKP